VSTSGAVESLTSSHKTKQVTAIGSLNYVSLLAGGETPLKKTDIRKYNKETAWRRFRGGFVRQRAGGRHKGYKSGQTKHGAGGRTPGEACRSGQVKSDSA